MRMLLLLMLVSCTHGSDPQPPPPVYDALQKLDVFDDVDAGVRCYQNFGPGSGVYSLSCVKVR